MMGFRFFKRVNIIPGVTLNISKSGPSVSVGPKHARVTFGPRGTRETIGIPGTGMSYTKQQRRHRSAQKPDTGTGTRGPKRTPHAYAEDLDGLTADIDGAHDAVQACIRSLQAGDTVSALESVTRSLQRLQDANVELNGLHIPAQGRTIHDAYQKGLNLRIEGVTLMKAAIESHLRSSDGDMNSLFSAGLAKHAESDRYFSEAKDLEHTLA